MRRASALVIGALVLLPAAARAETEEFRWQGRVPSGKTLEIKGVNGGIRAEAAGGDEVDVVARKSGRRSDPGDVEIKVVEHGEGVTICAVYPNSVGDGPNECRPGRGGRMNTRNNDVEVQFTVKLPAGLRFVGKTVNGSVDAQGLGGDAVAHTVNGDVEVSTAGNVQAETVNGSIKAELGRADWTGPVQFKTVNGSVTLSLPANTGAEVRASTVNGSIETDFPLTLHKGRFTGRRLSGTLGAGGRELQIETVNGSIELRQGR
jgi:hypothetical protein